MTCLPDVNVWIALIVAEHVGHQTAVEWYGGGAWDILDRVRQNRSIAFAREPAGIEDAWRGLTANRSVGHNFWTDAYLAAFAEASGFTLVTFDEGFRQYKNTPLKILSSPS